MSEPVPDQLCVREAVEGDLASMRARFGLNGWRKPHGYFEGLFEAAARDELCLGIAVDGEDYVGHLKVVWRPDYLGFRSAGIPEIQDLAVLPDYRRHGLGSRLLGWAEQRIATRSEVAGIGVGLYADYGPAQRMYVGRGYVPDGAGIYSGVTAVEPGGRVRVDDELVLWLVKHLG